MKCDNYNCKEKATKEIQSRIDIDNDDSYNMTHHLCKKCFGKEIINQLYNIQIKYNNNIDLFQKDLEFIELSNKINNYKPKILSAQKIINKIIEQFDEVIC